MKLTKILSFVLCVLMVCTLLLCGCNSKSTDSQDSSTKDEISVTETTEPDTGEVETTAPVSSTKKETVSATEKETQAKETTPATEDKNDSDNNSNAGPVNSQQSKPMTCTVTVADRDYTYELGDRFTYTCYLKTPDKIEDIQAQVNYTGRYLKLLSTTEESLPVIGEYAIFNADNANIIKYNATRYKGINFKEEGILITLEFEVVFGGYASISSAIEIMTGIDGTSYADSFKLAKDVKIRETIG